MYFVIVWYISKLDWNEFNIGPKKIINHVCFDIFRIESSQGNLEYMLS